MTKFAKWRMHQYLRVLDNASNLCMLLYHDNRSKHYYTNRHSKYLCTYPLMQIDKPSVVKFVIY